MIVTRMRWTSNPTTDCLSVNQPVIVRPDVAADDGHLTEKRDLVVKVRPPWMLPPPSIT